MMSTKMKFTVLLLVLVVSVAALAITLSMSGYAVNLVDLFDGGADTMGHCVGSTCTAL